LQTNYFMKHHFILYLLCLPFCLFCQKIKLETGTLKGAAYDIQIPENWNKKLVMYAHGYEMPTTPRAQMGKNDMLQIFLDRGFAVARSAYSRDGWALPEGVNDTEVLRQHFVKKYGKPDSTFITGHSMGGGVTVATLEKYPKKYNGALALCPLSSRPYEQVKIAFDAYVVFNAMFPGHLPTVADVMSGRAKETFSGDFGAKIGKSAGIIGAINAVKPDDLAAFVKHENLKMQDLPFNLMFLDGVLRNMATQSGGNPFDNTNTVYSGYPDDWEINKKVERVAATVSATRLTTEDRTGLLEKPMVMMHTTYDQLITPQFGIVNYDNLVHEKHKEQNLKVLLTNGQGHCAFSDAQVASAFDALRAWTTTGKKPTEMIVPTPITPQKDTLCYEMRIYYCHPGKLNNLLSRFRNHTTKLFEKHGMTNVGYWTPLDNPDNALYYVLSYPNRGARDASWAAFSADTTWQRVWKDSEAKGDIVAKIESIFLETTDFSPNNFKNSLNSGVWELRIYHTTPNNLGNLLDRFRGFTVNRFEEYGMTNKIYWTPTDATQGRDNMLYYFLTHPSPAAQKAAFDKFRLDPEWIATRKASEVKGGGSLTSKIESIFMYPVDFSKVK
jgi:pimeloyl-ACP methyl ester carboxylesterase